MKKNFFILFVLCVCVGACEDVYHPDIDKNNNFLVIEALLTNDTSSSYVKITRSVDFYGKEGFPGVSGASVFISDKGGNSHSLIESSTGVFHPDFSALAGESYSIKVEVDGEVYESAYELMPPPVILDTIYAEADTLNTYKYDQSGVPMAHNITGITVSTDFPVESDLKHYRVSMIRTLEYVILPPPDYIGPPLPPIWAWAQFYQSGVFPVYGPAEYGNESLLKKRKLLFLPTVLLEVDEAYTNVNGLMIGWIVDLSVFGINKNTFNYYRSLNSQLDADGKLFDPVYAQLESNIKCVSDPGKMVAGYFELNSVFKRRFYVMGVPGSKNVKFHYVDSPLPIPPNGRVQNGTFPEFWEDDLFR